MVLDSSPPERLPERDAALDPAYPTTTPPDAIYPGQTRRVLGHPLDEIATPSTWSRLAGPMERALSDMWNAMGLLERHRPSTWVSIHYGRIAVNSHAWERMRARCLGKSPDPSLVAMPESWFARAPDRFEAVRVRWSRNRFLRRVKFAEEVRSYGLARAWGLDPCELDTNELVRGPLDAGIWTEVLLPWLGTRMLVPEEPYDVPDRSIRTAIALERRWGAEIGARLCARGVLDAPSRVAYLTVEERIRAVHEPGGAWAELAAARREQVDHFTKVTVPLEFWGRPRVTTWSK